MTWAARVNIGCGPHYANGWANLDVIETAEIKPDLVVVPGEPLPFADGTVDTVFLGHVLEHQPWPEVPVFLADIRRILKPGGDVCVTGPDCYRTIKRWHEGVEPWHMVESVLEHSTHYQSSTEVWPQARHHWNCHEARVVSVLLAAGFVDVAPEHIMDGILDAYPIVSRALWQFAVLARKP